MHDFCVSVIPYVCALFSYHILQWVHFPFYGCGHIRIYAFVDGFILPIYDIFTRNHECSHVLTRFSTKSWLYDWWMAGGRSGGRILNGVKLMFPLSFFSLLWPIDTKLAVWVAYIKRQLRLLPKCMWSRSKSLLLKIEIQFPLNNFSLLWSIDTKLALLVAYIKTQLGIATQVSVINVKVTVTKIEIQFSLKNFSLLWPINTKLSVWVAYIKTQLVIATQLSVIKVNVTVTKNRNSVSAQ